MNRRRPGWAVPGLGALLLAAAAGAAEPPADAGKGRQPTPGAQPATPRVVYVPPLRGAPAEATRVGGSVRGGHGRTFALSVLAPDHVGLTAGAQPTLYWFTSEEVTGPAELTIIRPEVAAPLLALRLEPPLAAGFHRLRLAEHGVRLAPAVAYQWYVALIRDAQSRSRDVVAGGEIRWLAPPPELEARLREAAPAELPGIYAGAGYWYEAIDALSQRLADAPGDAALRAQRADLLAQVGLREAADFERRAAR